MKRRDFLIRASLIGGLGFGAFWLRDNVVWRRPDVDFERDGTTGWLPYARRAATPTVQAVIAGREVTALIDSGAQYSVINRALMDELGLEAGFDIPLMAYGVGGDPQMGKGTTLDVRIARESDQLTVTGLRAAILDLGPLADGQGLSAPLILGRDFLSELVLDLDPPRRRLRLTHPSTHDLSPDMAPVPVIKGRNALLTEVTVEGAVIRAVVDTGASSLLSLSEDAANAAGLLDGRPQTPGSSIVLGGIISARAVTSRTVTVGDRLFRDVEVSIYASSALPGFPAALLGMEAFADARMVLDMGRARLHVAQPLDLTIGSGG